MYRCTASTLTALLAATHSCMHFLQARSVLALKAGRQASERASELFVNRSLCDGIVSDISSLMIVPLSSRARVHARRKAQSKGARKLVDWANCFYATPQLILRHSHKREVGIVRRPRAFSLLPLSFARARTPEIQTLVLRHYSLVRVLLFFIIGARSESHLERMFDIFELLCEQEVIGNRHHFSCRYDTLFLFFCAAKARQWGKPISWHTHLTAISCFFILVLSTCIDDRAYRQSPVAYSLKSKRLLYGVPADDTGGTVECTPRKSRESFW